MVIVRTPHYCSLGRYCLLGVLICYHYCLALSEAWLESAYCSRL